MIVQRRAAEQERLAQDKAETAKLEELERFKREVIEHERQKLLKERAVGLMQYLPRV